MICQIVLILAQNRSTYKGALHRKAMDSIDLQQYVLENLKLFLSKQQKCL